MSDFDLRNIAPGSYEEVYENFEWDLPEKHNLAVDICDRWADDRDKVALYWENKQGVAESFTFNELSKWSNQFANALTDRGVEQGDIVSVFVPTYPESIVATLGTLKIGAISMPLYHLFGPGSVSQRLEAADSVALVVDEGGLEKMDESMATPEEVYLVRNDGNVDSDFDPVDFDALLSEYSRSFDPVETVRTDPAMLFYTSGTTGDPKGVLEAHQYSIGQRYIGQYTRDFSDDDILWHSGDLAWAGGFANLVEAWTLGIPILKYHGKFEARKALELLDSYNVTLFATAPTALRLLMDVPEEEIDSYDINLRVVASGGERVTPDLLSWTEKTFDTFATLVWGQTECYGIGWPPLGEEREEKLGALGRPLPGFEASILDENGNELPPGEVGEMAIARDPNPCLFLKYLDDPGATTAVTEGKWHRTGDSAYVDEDGFFWYQGRNDDIIISSGYRISPAEIESALNTYPAVKEAAVIGIPDEERTNIPKAFIELAKDSTPSEDLKSGIRRAVKHDLAMYQYPREIEFVENLPKTITGKIERKTLRERGQ